MMRWMAAPIIVPRLLLAEAAGAIRRVRFGIVVLDGERLKPFTR